MAADNFLWFPQAATGGLLKGKSNKPEGETSDSTFNKDTYKALEVLSFSFGVSQADTAGSSSSGAGVGKVKFDEFTIEKYVDLASVPIYNACAAGAHFPSVQLAIRKAGGSPLLYLQYIFRMVFVTNIGWSGGGGEESPKETIKFKFGAMGIQYIPQNPDGTQRPKDKMDAAWSVIANQPSLDVTGLPPAPAYVPAQ
jgi:type VI secretion system secreted protein Hcp